MAADLEDYPASLLEFEKWFATEEVSGSPPVAGGFSLSPMRIGSFLDKSAGKPGHELLPRVHRVASLLKRWWLGTHQGAIRAEHLDYDLDEFTFRFNRRLSRARGKLFYRLVQQAVEVEPVYWADIAAARRTRDHNK